MLTKLHALQLVQQMLQAIIVRPHVVAFGDRSIPLRARLRKKRLQHRDVGWQLIGTFAHAEHGIRFARRCEALSAV